MKKKVSTHLNAAQEWVEIDLMHRSIIEVGAEAISPMLLVIGQQVLGACLYANTLHANDGLICAFTVEIRVGAKTE